MMSFQGPSAESLGLKDGQWFWDLGPTCTQHPESGGVWELEERAVGSVFPGTCIWGP